MSAGGFGRWVVCASLAVTACATSDSPPATDTLTDLSWSDPGAPPPPELPSGLEVTGDAPQDVGVRRADSGVPPDQPASDSVSFDSGGTSLDAGPSGRIALGGGVVLGELDSDVLNVVFATRAICASQYQRVRRFSQAIPTDGCLTR